MSSDLDTARCTEFIRGYFIELNRLGISSALLHSWKEGPSGMLSDVDFVIDDLWIKSVPLTIENYCRQSGWRLCQVLWHEPTAAYCVCSAVGNPRCVVAFDACSDYQRDGVVLMSGEELLEGCEALDWGGFGLGEVTELRYRFVKAAIKGKDAGEIGQELREYPEGAKNRCEEWVRSKWAVCAGDWTKESLGEAFAQMNDRTRGKTALLSISGMRRVMMRAFHPTGLVVRYDAGTPEHLAEVREVFGRFYFRNFLDVERFPVNGIYALIRSTVIMVPHMSAFQKALLGRSMVIDLGELDDEVEVIEVVAEHLHRRCLGREKLN